MELQNGRFHILAGIRCPLVLSVGTDLLRVSRHWRFNSSAFGFCAHVIHVFRVHWKTRSRIMVALPSQVLLFTLRLRCSKLCPPLFCCLRNLRSRSGRHHSFLPASRFTTGTQSAGPLPAATPRK